MDGDLIDALRRRASEYGIHVSDLLPLEQGEEMTVAHLRRRDEGQEYLTLLSPHMKMSDSYPHNTWSGTPLLVLGAKVTPRNADRMRELGVNYLDANGNAYLNFGNVLIDVRGRTGDPIATLHLDKPGTSNLFSPKRAQLIFVLITWPEIVNSTLREIADASKVSVGFAQKTLIDLEAANYIETVDAGRRGRRLRNVDALIDGWVASFPGGIASPENTRSFRGDFELRYLSDSGPDVYVSGEAVAEWIQRNTTWNLYCDEIPREAASAGRWTAHSSNPNIFVRSPFWNEPEWHSNRSTTRIRTAPPLLVYADLVSSGESRQREAAEHYRSENVGLHANRPSAP